MKFLNFIAIIIIASIMLSCGSDSNPTNNSNTDDPNSIAEGVIKATFDNEKWETNTGKFSNITKHFVGGSQESLDPVKTTTLSGMMDIFTVHEITVGTYQKCTGSLVKITDNSSQDWTDINGIIEITSVSATNIKGKFNFSNCVSEKDNTKKVIKGIFNVKRIG